MKNLLIMFILSIGLGGCFQRSCPTYSGTRAVVYKNHTTYMSMINGKFRKENNNSHTVARGATRKKILPYHKNAN